MSRVINSLNFMYGMERFATEIYGTQGRTFTGNEIEDKFKAAMDNEHQHADDLQKRIIELNGTPSRLGRLFQIAGRLLGLITKTFGKPFILRADSWIEKRAIRDYGGFLSRVEFDEKSVDLIKRIIVDEERHVETWENSIALLKGKVQTSE